VQLYKAAIGARGQRFYYEQFARFKRRGVVGASWNWPAFVATLPWLIYRKMWLPAAAYAALPLVAALPMMVAFAFFGDNAWVLVWGIAIVYGVAAFVVPALYANALYFWHCQSKVREARVDSHELPQQLAYLERAGGTSLAGLVMAFAFALFPALAGAGALGYQWVVDARVRGEVADGIRAGKNALAAVSKYFARSRRLPVTLQETGYLPTLPKSVRAIRVDPRSGAVLVELAGGVIDGSMVKLLPGNDKFDPDAAKCVSHDVPARYLPTECRPDA
jgi:hypothetical protein